MQRVVVVGGGISGLAAAWELTGGGDGSTGGDAATEVVVLESSSRLGGALDSVPFGGRVVDTGPDGFLGRRPEALDLCREIGLDDALVPIAGRGAGVWARGKVRVLPEGLALGIPIRFWPAARSGILGLRGDIALARDAWLPRPDVRGPIGDRSIGPLVTRKLGRRVSDRLVDPLIGGIHAGSVDDMSAAATYPPLLAAAQKRGSLMRALRAEVPPPSPDAPPLFWALEDGMASMVEHLCAALTARGVEIRCAAPSIGSSVSAPGGTCEAVEGTTMRTQSCSPSLPPWRATCSGLTTTKRPGSWRTSTMPRSRSSPSASAPKRSLPRCPGPGSWSRGASPAPPGGEPWAVTACTYLSQKWPHVATEGEVLLRASVGRFGDDRAEAWSDGELVERVWHELGVLIGPAQDPLESMVARWPGAFPQYRVHHLLRTAGIEAAVARLGGIAVAGAAYRGVGIPACIASGRAAARAVS